MASVTITDAKKSYSNKQVLHGIDLEIQDGEFVVFVGPSGCGKSTLLRMIAGLEDISDGEIAIGEDVVNDVAPAKRGVAMVFQTYALYPHMTVYKNMAFGLRQTRMAEEEIDKRVREAAEILHISDLLERTPRALSGGQRQRVAIGRAIVREPRVFLFDEPLSNLDAALRVQMRFEIGQLHADLGTTMIYVTHDQVEAMTLADRIVVLRDGKIEQVGTPVEVYDHPKNMFVAQFIGSPKMNFFSPAALTDYGRSQFGKSNSDEVMIGVRPEHLRLADSSKALVTAKLQLTEQLGEYVLAHFATEDGTHFLAKMERQWSVARGETVSFDADMRLSHVFDCASGEVLS